MVVWGQKFQDRFDTYMMAQSILFLFKSHLKLISWHENKVKKTDGQRKNPKKSSQKH